MAELTTLYTDLVKNSSGIDCKPFSHGKFARNWTLAGLSFQFPVSRQHYENLPLLHTDN